jgi:PKD repeat protein
MRTATLTFAVSAMVLSLAGCTVKEVDVPALAGPSTVGYAIELQSNTNTLVQDGLSQARITITARDHMGQPMNGRPLRAEIRVDGVAQDYGTLSTKNPVTGSTLIYTAPPASSLSQRTQAVTISVLPMDSGVFGDEFGREIELILVPQGVILPFNPNLVPLFTVSPAAPKVMDIVTFNAAGTTNNGVACNTNCLFAWDFGDGTTGSGQTVTHQFRTVGSVQVRLTVTDARSATATAVQTLTIAPGTPPTSVTFTTSPATPGVNQDVFFNASASQAAPGRTLTKFEWDFGDGTTGSGVVTSHKFEAGGNFQVTLTVTDDAGATGRNTVAMQIGPALGPEPVAEVTCQGGRAAAGEPVSCNASTSKPGTGANIVSYTFSWGDGSPEEVHTNPVQSHLYPTAGGYTVTVTVRDSLGRVARDQERVVVAP